MEGACTKISSAKDYGKWSVASFFTEFEWLTMCGVRGTVFEFSHTLLKNLLRIWFKQYMHNEHKNYVVM